MLDPSQLYTIVDDTPAEDPSPVLYFALTGFMDAGQAGALAADHVLDELDHRIVAAFDCDQLIDYRSRRPAMTFDGDHYADVEEFSLALHVVTDLDDREFYLLRGPEPDFQWNRFVAATHQLVTHFGVALTVTGHGVPWAAPHTRPLRGTAYASRRELISGQPRWTDAIKVPGNMMGLLTLRLGQAGVDSVGFAVHVPHYLSDIEYPPAAVALLESIVGSTDLALPLDDLRTAGSEVLSKVDEQVAQAPQLQETLTSWEKAFDAESDGLGIGTGAEIPEGELPGQDALAAEVEDFLRGMNG